MAAGIAYHSAPPDPAASSRYFADITELIGRQTALSESQRQFRDFAETSADWL
jgi:hypothetical protein